MVEIKLSRINFYTIFKDILGNLWVIILAALIGFFGSITYYNHFHSYEYTSSMTVSINLSGYTTDATALSLARVVSIAETLDDVFQSDAMIDAVKKDLGEEVSSKISAVQQKETNLITVMVTDSSPDKAFRVLNNIKKNYSKVTDDVFSNVIINVVVNPSMPSVPSNSVSTTRQGVIFGVLFVILAAAVIAVLSYMRDTVKNVSDVEQELSTKLFGVVNHVKMPSRKLPANKRGLIVSNSLVGYDFSESFRRMAIKLESLQRSKGVKTVMITSVTENEGKTSVSTNIAVSLAQNGNRVLLMDCDLRKPSVHYFFKDVKRAENSDFVDYLKNGGNIAEVIKFDSATGLYIIDSINACENSSERLSGRIFSETVMALKEQFDYIIIDTPPCGLMIDAETVSQVADAVLLVVRQDYVRVTDINDQLENMSKSYIAGCIFNDAYNLRSKNNSEHEYSGYYYHNKA